jgi:hypothetical protein
LRIPAIMHADDSDREQIELMVRELMAKPTPTRVAQPEPKAAQQVDISQLELRPGSRWSNVRLLMPLMRAPRFEERFPYLSSMGLRWLAEMRRMYRAPGPAAAVRAWVGLSVLYAASMAYWPYPRTYLWGLVFYLMSLGLMLVSGVWGARLSWDARLGGSHTLAIGSVLWAVTLAAAEALPPY